MGGRGLVHREKGRGEQRNERQWVAVLPQGKRIPRYYYPSCLGSDIGADRFNLFNPVGLLPDPGFGEGPPISSKRTFEGSSTLSFPDLDIGCDLVDLE